MHSSLSLHIIPKILENSVSSPERIGCLWHYFFPSLCCSTGMRTPPPVFRPRKVKSQSKLATQEGWQEKKQHVDNYVEASAGAR